MKTSAVLCFLAVMVLSQPGDATEQTVLGLGELLVVSSSLFITDREAKVLFSLVFVCPQGMCALHHALG